LNKKENEDLSEGDIHDVIQPRVFGDYTENNINRFPENIYRGEVGFLVEAEG